MEISKRLIYLLALGCLPAVGSCAPSNSDKLGVVEGDLGDELAQRYAVVDQTISAIKSRDYSKLNKLEKDFRSRRSLTSSGTWKLREYYNALTKELSSKDRPERCTFENNQFLTDWERFDPRAPAAPIVRANLMVSYASCQRGYGYERSVSAAEAARAASTLQLAYSSLQAKRAFASVDPEFFVAMGKIYLGLGRSDSDFQKLLDEGIRQEPYYYNLYYQGFVRHMPRWYGQPGDVAKFAQHAADMTHSGAGMGTYARLYWYMVECNCGDDDETAKMNWEYVKEGMDDIFSSYPTDWNASNFAQLSCLNNDKEETAKYFGKVKRTIPEAWNSSTEERLCRQAALE